MDGTRGVEQDGGKSCGEGIAQPGVRSVAAIGDRERWCRGGYAVHLINS
jgi:hypothetical protein